MPDKTFVDTNVWLYALLPQKSDAKHRRAEQCVFALVRPWINSQVIREASSNLLKKGNIPENRLREIISDWYQDCEVHPSTADQHVLASEVRVRHTFSYWDSLIVAAALDAGCTLLYSEDMQHGQNIDDRLTIINPFVDNA